MNYFSDIVFKDLPAMTVVSMTRIGQNPEEEVISDIQRYMVEHDIPAYSECYGFDVPLPQEQAHLGMRGYEYWVKVPDSYKDKDVEVKKIPGYQYILLTITDPFSDPFVRIPKGWKALVAWMEENPSTVTAPHTAACLETVYEKDGVTCMDVMIPVRVL